MPYRRTAIQIRLQDNNDFIIGLESGHTFMVEKRRAPCASFGPLNPSKATRIALGRDQDTGREART